ncbi:MAG: YifB family Mg chelatase-like AAA ATPase [Clostridia bacterium]|nr:YifB family Mg chelatase-like AAA ATPase [Clostridia bacterium]
MVATLKSCATVGVDGKIVEVEVDTIKGMPSFDIVGLADTAVKESKERVRSALKNSGIKMPSMKYTINLAPADMKKEGVFYDLPIALGIAVCLDVFKAEALKDSMFIGELSLNGDIRRVSGILPCSICAKENNIKRIFVPEDNAKEAAVVDGVEVYACKDFRSLVKFLAEGKGIEPEKYTDPTDKLGFDGIDDFADVKGQNTAKRALEIAAAGGHNCCMIGSPGTGKTMLAKRIGSILPEMTLNEALEVTKIHSIAGVTDKNTSLITKRPFRSPHHTVSAAGLSGGGAVPKPGEVSLAHNGVLFLDEFPEFRKDAIEILRQPLEDGKITVSRVHSTVVYPSNIMLVAAMNPCKCGYFGDPEHECKCTPTQIEKYMSKISGPIMDRIDIHIKMNPVKFEELKSMETGEKSETIRERVNKARKIQLERFKDDGIYSNAQMSSVHIRKYCVLGEAETQLLKIAFDKFALSARAYDKILKLARTIADLAGSENITTAHISEAISYRSLDRS